MKTFWNLLGIVFAIVFTGVFLWYILASLDSDLAEGGLHEKQQSVTNECEVVE